MVIDNPYRIPVLQDKNILTDTSQIYAHAWKWDIFFGDNNPLVLEIGTGMGNFFAKQVGEHPEKNFIGMELKYKRLHFTAQKSRKNLPSIKENFVVLKDFWQNIKHIFADEEITETFIFFPDPWGKKNTQKKHRIIQAEFMSDLFQKTKFGGKVFFKSDHREYFESTVALIQKQWLWNIIKINTNYENDEVFDTWNITEFEAMYRGAKIEINYLELQKK